MGTVMAAAERDVPDVPSGHQVAGASVAMRPNRLFAVVHPKNRGAYTNAEVAADMGVSAVLVGQWRTGRAADPRRTPESMRTVLTMINHVRASEGLPPLPDEN
ncbi:hypothetical protein [Streptomyces sp. NPDC051662]|uniref:hypothetical protein n=1 Tax=Streptomyces sp. NPDC051662 TaxID=3154750 RepID=UPI00343B0A66